MKYRPAVMIKIEVISTKIGADMIRIAADTNRIAADMIRIVADMIRIVADMIRILVVAPTGEMRQAVTKVVMTVWAATTRDITKVVATRTTRASSRATRLRDTRPKDTNLKTKGTKAGGDTKTNTTTDVPVADTEVADVNCTYLYFEPKALSSLCLVKDLINLKTMCLYSCCIV